jgi:hypothetical protein
VPPTNTPKPTRPPAPTKTATAIPPTAPPSAPGADLIAPKGGESCVTKFISASFPWEEEGDRKMYFWDKSWSPYIWFARPGIKPSTAQGVCDEKQQCQGFKASFCVYVDGDAPSGDYESIAHVIVFSQLANNTGLNILAEFETKFSWRIP